MAARGPRAAATGSSRRASSRYLSSPSSGQGLGFGITVVDNPNSTPNPTPNQVLIFPESHPRGSALSRLMASHVLKEHDTDGNGRVENAELKPP